MYAAYRGLLSTNSIWDTYEFYFTGWSRGYESQYRRNEEYHYDTFVYRYNFLDDFDTSVCLFETTDEDIDWEDGDCNSISHSYIYDFKDEHIVSAYSSDLAYSYPVVGVGVRLPRPCAYESLETTVVLEYYLG